MSNDISIKISTDTKDAKQSIITLNNGFEQMQKLTKNNRILLADLAHTFTLFSGATQVISSLKNHILSLNSAMIETNKLTQNFNVGFATLLASNMQNAISANKKYNLALKESNRVLEDLKETSFVSSTLLETLTSSFKRFYNQTSNLGSLDKALQTFKNLAIVANPIGTSLDELTTKFARLAKGEVASFGELQDFLKYLKITNEELKQGLKDGNFFDLINAKLKDNLELAKQVGVVYSDATTKLKNEFDELIRSVSKPIFSSLAKQIDDLSNFLHNNKEQLKKYIENLIYIAKELGKLGAIFLATKGAIIGYNLILSASSAIMPIFASKLNLAITSTTLLTRSIQTLNTAFKAFLPVATLYGIYKLYEISKALKDITGQLYKNMGSYGKLAFKFFDAWGDSLRDAYIWVKKIQAELVIAGAELKKFVVLKINAINP